MQLLGVAADALALLLGVLGGITSDREAHRRLLHGHQIQQQGAELGWVTDLLVVHVVVEFLEGRSLLRVLRDLDVAVADRGGIQEVRTKEAWLDDRRGDAQRLELCASASIQPSTANFDAA